jgi:hypothetical protein
LLNLWFGQLLVGFESEDVVVDLFARSVEDNFRVDELVLRMLFRESAIFWDLYHVDFTSGP